MKYLLPNVGSFDVVGAAVGPSGIRLTTPSTLRELVLFDDTAVSLFAVSSEMLLQMSSFADELFPSQVPLVVLYAPGVAYDAPWQSAATVFPPVTWDDFQKSVLAKSGTTAFTPRDLASRRSGARVYQPDSTPDDVDRFDGEV